MKPVIFTASHLMFIQATVLHISMMGESIFTSAEFCAPSDLVTMNRIFCNREPVILECLDSQYISEINLNYGRTTDRYCGNIIHPDDSKVITDCTDQSNAEEVINNKCHYKESCHVQSKELKSTDCGSGSKYVNVTYSCHEVIGLDGVPRLDDKTACEDEKVLTLDCKEIDNGYIIVSSATYGRTDPDLCYKADKNANALTCRAHNSLSVVESLCQGKNECTIDNFDAKFSDPCPEIYKYLHIKYVCGSGN